MRMMNALMLDVRKMFLITSQSATFFVSGENYGEVDERRKREARKCGA